MSQTRAQRSKHRKIKARQRSIRKQHNIQQNAPKKRFRLDVELDGIWRNGVKEWAHASQVEAHKNETEARRAKGDEIAPGRVVDMNLRKVVLEIEGSRPKGSAPDKIADGSKVGP